MNQVVIANGGRRCGKSHANDLGYADGEQGRDPRSIDEVGHARWVAYAYGYQAGKETRRRRLAREGAA